MMKYNEPEQQDSSSDGDNRIKVIYVDIKSLKFINPLLQEIIPSAILNKYTPYFQKNYSLELMERVETELKKTLKLLIFSSSNMLIHKVCPVEEDKRTITKEMHEKALDLFSEFLEIFREKKLQEAYFKLLELHNHISNIPDTQRFFIKLEEMMNEITAAIENNQNKEIFCFDVTNLFEAKATKCKIFQDREKFKYLLEERKRWNRGNSPVYDRFSKYWNNDGNQNSDIIRNFVSGFWVFCVATWSISKTHIFPYLLIFSQVIGKKMWKRILKVKF